MKRALIVVGLLLIAGCAPTAAQKNLGSAQSQRDAFKDVWQRCVGDPECAPEELTRDKQQLDEADLEYDRARADVSGQKQRAMIGLAGMMAAQHTDFQQTYYPPIVAPNFQPIRTGY